MADWTNISGGGDVEDRRGLKGPGLAVGGIGGIVLFLAMMFLNSQGVDTSMLQQALQDQQPAGQIQSQPAEFAGQDEYEVFAGKVLGSANDSWRAQFRQAGATYVEPKLVLFRGSTQSGCGVAVSAMGPHYCPTDSTIYLDETFFDELKNQLGGSNGDVAQAYVIAHEVGHHVQNVTGDLARAGASSEDQNAVSVRQELQADCYAGLWMHDLDKAGGVLQPGEIDEALSAASAVGDDHVQQTSGSRVNPETWTHGSSEQRKAWFSKGYESGSLAACRG